MGRFRRQPLYRIYPVVIVLLLTGMPVRAGQEIGACFDPKVFTYRSDTYLYGGADEPIAANADALFANPSGLGNVREDLWKNVRKKQSGHAKPTDSYDISSDIAGEIAESARNVFRTGYVGYGNHENISLEGAYTSERRGYGYGVGYRFFDEVLSGRCVDMRSIRVALGGGRGGVAFGVAADVFQYKQADLPDAKKRSEGRTAVSGYMSMEPVPLVRWFFLLQNAIVLDMADRSNTWTDVFASALSFGSGLTISLPPARSQISLALYLPIHGRVALKSGIRFHLSDHVTIGAGVLDKDPVIGTGYDWSGYSASLGARYVAERRSFSYSAGLRRFF